MTHSNYITKASIDATGQLDLLLESLEKEYKLMPQYAKSKLKQIERVKAIQSEIATIFEWVDKFEEQQMRLEGCCLSHGIGQLAIRDFKAKPMIEVINDVKRSVNKQYRLPLYLVEQFEPEVKTTDKPTLKWTYVDGKLTPDRKLKSTLPSVKEIIEG